MSDPPLEIASLGWKHGVVSVESLAGQLGPTVFVLPDGRPVSPFHIAPWADESAWSDQPGVLRRLRGEWPCVPFGSDSDRAAADGWPAAHAMPTVDSNPHGFSSNHPWRLQPPADGRLELSIDYPAGHPIAGLRRRITPDPQVAALDFELAITARLDCDLPIGLHPVFRLPAEPGSLLIELGGLTNAQTFPGDPDASSIFAPGKHVQNWHGVPLRGGGTLDPARLPLTAHTEEVLQVLRAPGHVALWNAAESYRVHLSWNAGHFPSLMFWFSNFGRQAPPWSGRHLALGVEPICGALDLGPQISAQPNPISAQGVPTSHHFSAGETFVTRYRVSVEAAPGRSD